MLVLVSGASAAGVFRKREDLRAPACGSSAFSKQRRSNKKPRPKPGLASSSGLQGSQQHPLAVVYPKCNNHCEGIERSSPRMVAPSSEAPPARGKRTMVWKITWGVALVLGLATSVDAAGISIPSDHNVVRVAGGCGAGSYPGPDGYCRRLRHGESHRWVYESGHKRQSCWRIGSGDWRCY